MVSKHGDLHLRIATLERLVKASNSAPRLQNASLDDAFILDKGEDGRVKAIIGRQPDGSHGFQVHQSPDQPTPTGLTVVLGDRGSATASWDGTVSGGTVPLIHGRVDVLVQFAGDGETPDPEQARVLSTIRDRNGGATSISLPQPGEWYICLQMVGQDRVTRSAFSEPVVITVEPLVSEEDIAQRIRDFASGGSDVSFNALAAGMIEALAADIADLATNSLESLLIETGALTVNGPSTFQGGFTAMGRIGTRQPLALLNGFTPAEPCSYTQVGDLVILSGAVTPPSGGYSGSIAALPAPAQTRSQGGSCITSAGVVTPVNVRVSTAGWLTVVAPSGTTAPLRLDGLTYMT